MVAQWYGTLRYHVVPFWGVLAKSESEGKGGEGGREGRRKGEGAGKREADRNGGRAGSPHRKYRSLFHFETGAPLFLILPT